MVEAATVDVVSNRQRILDTALDSFGTTGVDGTSLDALARDLGLRKQSILYYFPSKVALFQAVIDEAAASEVPVDAGPRSIVLLGPDRKVLALGELTVGEVPGTLRAQPHVVFPWVVREGRT